MREKVLYLSGFSPFSINGGGNQRCKLILDALLTKYDVDVVVDFDAVNDLEVYGIQSGGVQLIDIPDDTSSHLIDRTVRKILLNFIPGSLQHLMPTNVWRFRKIHKLIKANNYRWIVVRYLAGVTYHKLYGFKNLVIDIEFHITGMKSLSKEILDLPWVHDYSFLNKNNPEEYRRLVEIMSCQDVFLFPSKAECSSIALCEANAFGLPCFVYDTGGTANYVSNGYNGYMLPLSSCGYDFANKIIECIDNGKLRTLSDNARNQYISSLNWDVWSRKVGELINKL